MNTNTRAVLLTLLCICLLSDATQQIQAQPYVIPPPDFLTAEARYYDTVDTLRQLVPYVQNNLSGWVPKEEEPSGGRLYVVASTSMSPIGSFSSVSVRTLRVANYHYCILRDSLLQKAGAKPGVYELPKCDVVLTQDAISQVAKSDDFTALQLTVSRLDARVRKLENKKVGISEN